VTGRRRGFTLIELLVVMAIIATLLTIAVPRYFRSIQRYREAILKQDLATLRESIDKFYARAADKSIVVNSDDPEDNGVKDVKSGAEGMGENGVPFVAW